MEIQDLVNRFEVEHERFISSSYNEAQLRTDFLDPLFKLLGWDITNEQGRPTNEREVLVEEGLRGEVSENTKKPDYTFRLFAERKFFVEAKKPFVKIETDAEAAKQVRRYGFTAKLKISVLTNFEYLAIYDCSQIVEETDQAQKRRLKLYHYTEFQEKFEEIKSLIGREEVYSGQFDVEWGTIERQIQTYNIDDLFLAQINEWRVLLGTEIYSNNPDIEESQLNDIVQSYINSIVFLRVCEDRNIELYKTLLNLAENRDFSALIQVFRNADGRFNAGLFSQPLNEEIISNESNAFWDIIKQLYFPESSYSFSVLSSDILGHIYEIFLGEQLKIDDGTIVLRRKPEVEDRDIVTTPTFIVRDILAETVQKYCEGKTDEEILDSKFADIACGSGAFLLETFQLLQDILKDYYVANNPDKVIQVGINNYKLKFEVKNQILRQCIFGIDKDFNAVEACKFGLLLKLLENEDRESIPIPALPSLNNNIHFGNSLISPDQTTSENRDLINPYDFGTVKYDVIVGNPPYLATEHIKKFTPLEKEIYENNYISADGQYDKYYLFLERGIHLLSENGYLGLIIPNKFLKIKSAENLREYIADERLLSTLINFGSNQIFQNKTTYTCLFILKKSINQNFDHISISNIEDWKTRNNNLISFDQESFNDIDSKNWVIVPPHLKSSYNKIIEQSVELQNLAECVNGIQTSSTLYIFYLNKINITEDFYEFEKDGQIFKIEKSITRPYYQTKNKYLDPLSTYRDLKPNSFIIFPYNIDENNVVRLMSLEQFRVNFPETFRYLEYYKEKLLRRKADSQFTEMDWFKFGRSQNLIKTVSAEKIFVGVLSNGNKYPIDYHSTYFTSGGTAGYCMINLFENSQYSIHYIQALLNSKYGEWFASIYGEIFKGAYIARGTKVLKRLPIRKIDFANEVDTNVHNRISETQQILIYLQSRIDENRTDNRALISLEREFIERKTELEDLLKELFNLGEDENLIPQISEIYATD